MTITGVDLTQGNIQTKPFSPVDIFTTTMVDLPPAADHEGALVYVAGTGLLLSDGTSWSAVSGAGAPSFPGLSGDAVWQQFSFSLLNDGGVIKHRFGAANVYDQATMSPGNFSAVNAAATSYTATPTGLDTSTPFAGGAKIQNNSGSPNQNLLFDTESQSPYDSMGMQVVLALNTTGNSVRIWPTVIGADVNGVNKVRMAFQVRNATTGATIPITTSLIPSGKELWMVFTGFMHPFAP